MENSIFLPFFVHQAFSSPHLHLPSLPTPLSSSLLLSSAVSRGQLVVPCPQSLNLPIFNQRDPIAKENPESEDGGMEWVTGAMSPGPQCKSQRKPLAALTLRDKLPGRGINVIFPPVEFITVYGKIDANLHE